ncbi:MAG: polyketide synthase, partial [Myxococcota bacterium]
MISREELENALRKAASAAVSARKALDETRGPIAVVGVGLRLPGGAHDLASLHEVLTSGRDLVRPIPSERFDLTSRYHPDPDHPGTTYVQHAYLLDDVRGFDAALFGISPREAQTMDPQHRLLLESSWTALEHAGFDVRSLEGSSTGIFVGIGPNEYARYRGRKLEHADAYDVTGSHPAFAAGRLSYHLGLRGPAMALDTACSSSLVAIHLACEHLRHQRCSLALAAGVQVIADPDVFCALSKTRALAQDGRCKTFSDDADGYGRGEGVGVLALMRLNDAQAQGRRILGLVRGTAVGHDGRSAGITAPNGTAQREVLEYALQNAGLTSADVDYVECHGTGTSLGDPLELTALDAVYGQKRSPQNPLAIGAAKTNIGHLESAAGIAGVLKVLASLHHSELPPSLHCEELNAKIDWPSLNLTVSRHKQPWLPVKDRPRRAGVSAFGLSGTNAHIIVEEAPAAAPQKDNAAWTAAEITLSAHTADALRSQARQLSRELVANPVRLGDLAARLAAKTKLGARLGIVASSSDANAGYPTLSKALKRFASNGSNDASFLYAEPSKQTGKL